MTRLEGQPSPIRPSQTGQVEASKKSAKKDTESMKALANKVSQVAKIPIVKHSIRPGTTSPGVTSKMLSTFRKQVHSKR